MTVYEEQEARLHTFLNSTLRASKWLASFVGRLPPQKELRYSLNRGMPGTQSWYEPGREDKSPFLNLMFIIPKCVDCKIKRKGHDSQT